MRLTFAAVAWLGLAAAATFLVNSEKQLKDARAAARAFDQHAREAADGVGELRAAQEAYVAAGQGIAYWIPKVAAISASVSTTVGAMASAATAPAAKNAAAEASKALSDFAAVDKRARDYVKADQQLMAADVIFTEGSQTLTGAAQQIELAASAERQSQETAELAARIREAAAAGSAAAFAGVVLLAFARRPKSVRAEPSPTAVDDAAADIDAASLPLREPAEPVVAAPAPAAPALGGAADICTGLARAREANDLDVLLGRAADLLDAKGLIVWLGDGASDDLRPVLAHGYPEHVVVRMPPVTRTADNAAARAYCTGRLQVVPGRAGGPDGAIAAPLLSPDGCIGVFTLELRHGAEVSRDTQALAAIIAAQLAALLGGAQTTAAAEPEPAASAG